MSTRTAPNEELIMRQIAERHPSHAQNTSSISLSSTHSDTTARYLHQSDVQGAMFSDVLLTRLESLSNQFRSIVRTPSTRAVALSTVDREIDAAMLLTRALLTHRNTLAPISVLPPEVLARIFHLVAGSPWQKQESLRWISVTHVCRHWRQVALDDSSLWAKISGRMASTTWISEMLARARNAPLAIDLLETPDAETLAMFTAHFAHTHEFRLRGLVTPHFDDSIREICSLEAPALEHFELGVRVAPPVTFLRAPFFNGMAPKLRTFSLSQIHVPWSFIPRGQLTQLKITLFGEGEPIAGGPSLGDSNSLIDLLINCPVLEILVLESCLPQSITRPSHVQAIHLPHLSYLSLRGSSSRVANLFRILKLPPSTALRMRCTSENTATNNDHHLLPLVSAHFHDPASVEIKSFKVTSNHMGRLINFAAYTYLPVLTTYPSYVFEGDVNAGAALVLSFDTPSEALDILGPVCSMLPISNIEFLSISASNADPSVNWGGLFQRCAKLTTIEANGDGTSSLLKELAPPKPKKAASGGKGRKGKLGNEGVPAPAPSSNATAADTPVPIFPNLASLSLRNLDFGDKLGDRPGVLFDALSIMLRRRRACKVPLKMLGIDHCIVTTNRANALRKLVPEFVRHGYEGSSLDEFDDFGYFLDVGSEDRWGDYSFGSTQAEWEWLENYSDGW
ncbi:hypothetical protein BC826DRAFT_170889 [Russula brevipes]|nr:hypothetical protein BC826DRAFT_170889 [Russula brevipes]